MSVSSVITYCKTRFIREQEQQQSQEQNKSLTISTIITIAIDLAQKIHTINGLSGSDKKALLLLLLKRGMDESGVQSSFDILKTASVVVDSIILASNGGMRLRKPSFWQNGFPHCLSSVDAVSPSEQQLLKDATLLSNSLFDKEMTNDPSAN